MPLITRRSSTRRAPGWFFGSSGSIAAQARSESQNSAAMIPSRPLPQKGITGLPHLQWFDWVSTLAPEAAFFKDIEAQEYHETVARRQAKVENAAAAQEAMLPQEI